jgi:hypothetical protein
VITSVGEEPLRYQTPLLDIGPTINGFALDDGPEEYIANGVASEVDGDEEMGPPPDDPNAPAPEMPEWIRGEQEFLEPVYAVAPPGRPHQDETDALKAPALSPAMQHPDEDGAPADETHESSQDASMSVPGDENPPDAPPAKAEGRAKRPAEKGDRGDKTPSQRGNDAPKASAPRTLEITFRPSGDIDRDKYRLKEIVERVRDPKGRDRFQIVVQSNGRKTRLAFPAELCTINNRLTTDLEKHFRVDVRIAE